MAEGDPAYVPGDEIEEARLDEAPPPLTEEEIAAQEYALRNSFGEKPESDKPGNSTGSRRASIASGQGSTPKPGSTSGNDKRPSSVKEELGFIPEDPNEAAENEEKRKSVPPDQVIPDTCDRAIEAEPCKAEDLDSRPPNKEVCESSNCPALSKMITIGEPEKEQLIAVGNHLFEIGRQLMEEMNYVESILGKFGAFFDSGDKGSAGGSNRNSREETVQVQQPSGNRASRGGCQNPFYIPSSEQLMTEEDVEALKAQLLLAIAAQAKRLNKVQQKHEELRKSTAEEEKFATPPEYPETSIVPAGSNNVPPEQLGNIANLEAKLSDLASRLEKCEQQISQVYCNLKEMISKTIEDSESLKEEVRMARDNSEGARQTYDDKLDHLDKQVMKLAQIVWELKCETRAQMHFGKEF